MVLLLVSAAVPLMLREVVVLALSPAVPLVPLLPSQARKVMASVKLPL